MKIMSKHLAVFFCFFVCALCGCESVFVEAPVGEKIPETQLKQFEGWWRIGKSVDPIRIEYTSGKLIAATLEHDDDKGYCVVKTELDLRMIGKNKFVFAKNEEINKFLIFLLEFDQGRKVTLREPSGNYFRELLKAGKLDNLVKAASDRNVVLTSNQKLISILEGASEDGFPVKGKIEVTKLFAEP